MMVAMMLPGAAPMVLLYARVMRKAESDPGAARVGIAAFASGYLAVWILFSLFAVFLQFGLERIGVMSAMMSLSRAHLAAGFLIAAGLYQLTPLKSACLIHCRGPAAFLAAHWRAGISGAFRMGLAHGAYCLGCCAVLMLLLFVGGVMNLVWIAGLTLLVAVEKLAPFGAVVARAMGAVLIVGGLTLLAVAP
jgi:predicted metal-binding membrane protein